jgi:ribosomal protein L17
MPAPTKGRRPGGSTAHQRHMLANLATALFEPCKITTTEARARRLRPVAERLITFAKRSDLHARLQVLTMVTDRNVVHAVRRDRAELRSPRGRLHSGSLGGTHGAGLRDRCPGPVPTVALYRFRTRRRSAALSGLTRLGRLGQDRGLCLLVSYLIMIRAFGWL